MSRGYLGVSIGTVTPLLAKDQKLPVQRGVLVAGLDPDGPGARAGLAEGDVVVALNGVEVKSDSVLRNTIAMIKPGTTVDLEVVHRTGNKATIKPKLGELPADNIVRGTVRPKLRQQQQQQQRRQQQQQQHWP